MAAKACSILDSQTHEANIFYKSDRDQVFSSLYEVLNNSDMSYQTGVKNQFGDFVQLSESPILSDTTIEGKTQKFIRNGYLNGKQVAPNTYEATDELAAEILYQELLALNYGEFRRDGNNFEFGDFTAKIEPDSIGYLGAKIRTDYIDQISQNPEPKTVNYTESQLFGLIQNFFQKVGFSVVTLENYKKNYKTKYGVEPDANALIDFANRVVALKNGTADVSELSEEFCHFVIESWDAQEIDRMLDYVNSTREYAQYAAQYREVYGKTIKDPMALERAVRKEILGKMLSEALQREFTKQDRTETESNLFDKLLQILRDFLDRFFSNLSPSLEDNVNTLAREVANRLYNETLDKTLDQGIDPVLGVMYSLNPKVLESILHETRVPEDIRYSTDKEKQIVEAVSSIIGTGKATNQAILDDYAGVNKMATMAVAENVIGTRELVLKIRANMKKAEFTYINDPKEYQTAIKYRDYVVDITSRALAVIDELEGNYKTSGNADIVSNLRELAQKNTNLTEEEFDRQLDEDDVTGIQKDASVFHRELGNFEKSSNIAVRMGAKILKNMINAIELATNRDVKQLVMPLYEYAQSRGIDLKGFIKNRSYIISEGDVEKKQREEQEYELSILSALSPNKYGQMSLEEFMEYRSGLKKLPWMDRDNAPDLYYEFKYRYDAGLASLNFKTQAEKDYAKGRMELLSFMPLGIHPSTSIIYRDIVDRSVARKLDMAHDRSLQNPFDIDGNPKEGFIPMLWKTYKDNTKYRGLDYDVVSTNSRHNLKIGEQNNPKDSDIVYVYETNTKNQWTTIAYGRMKWNALRAESMNQTINYQGQNMSYSEFVKKSFETAYKTELRRLRSKGLSDLEVESQIRLWLKDNILFEPTADYWDSMSKASFGIDFDAYYSVVSKSQSLTEQMETLETSLKKLQAAKSQILKQFKSKNDYKEVDTQSMSKNDKDAIYDLEDRIASVQAEILKKFKDNGVDAYGNATGMDSNLRWNQSFRQDFRDVTGLDVYDPAVTMADLELFFVKNGNLSTLNVNKYARLKSALNKNSTRKDPMVGTYEDRARELGLDPSDPNDVKKAFLMQNSPVWYKRYDSNAQYDNFIRDYTSGKLNVLDLIDSYIQNDNVLYDDGTGNPRVLDSVQITPSFRYTIPQKPDIRESYNEYLTLGNDTEADLKRKYDLIQKMGGVYELDPSYRVDISSEVAGDRLKAYVMFMDQRLANLDKYDMLREQFVFLLPQKRKGNLERKADLLQKGNRIAQLKHALKEWFTFTEDDYEDSYMSQTVPRYGFYKLPAEEVSQDILEIMVWDTMNANQYQERNQHIGDYMAAMQALEGMKFEKGRKATDTNYWSMMNEQRDYSFYGKTVSAKAEFKVPVWNRTIDLTKFLMLLKRFSLSSALGLSPIVAATNFTSGVTQNLMMAAAGRDIYSPANKRASLLLAKILPESAKDIGKFQPDAKINKILYEFGIYNIEDRFRDAEFNTVLRMLPRGMFSMMALTNFPLQAISALTKLTEYRLIDGRFMTWRRFLTAEMAANPGVRESELKQRFEQAASQSMYDYMDSDGQLDEARLRQDGYEGDLAKDKLAAMGEIQKITELTTMEMKAHNEGQAARDPRWSFFLSLKKWLVIATSVMTNRGIYDMDTGVKDIGLIYSPEYFVRIFKSYIKDRQSIMESYHKLAEHEQKAVRQSLAISGTLVLLLGLAMLLKGAADDDEEKDDYLLQLSAYMAMRNLNETFSGTLGLGDSYFQALQNPLVVGSTIKNLQPLYHFGDMTETVKQGKYKGMNKYMASVIKATWLRNMYSVSSAEALNTTSQSFLHFSQQDSLYTLLDFLPNSKKDDNK